MDLYIAIVLYIGVAAVLGYSTGGTDHALVLEWFQDPGVKVSISARVADIAHV